MCIVHGGTKATLFVFVGVTLCLCDKLAVDLFGAAPWGRAKYCRVGRVYFCGGGYHLEVCR